MPDEPEKRDPAQGTTPPAETPEEKRARLARVIAEAKAKKEAAAQAGGATPATSDEEKAAKIADAALVGRREEFEAVGAALLDLLLLHGVEWRQVLGSPLVLHRF